MNNSTAIRQVECKNCGSNCYSKSFDYVGDDMQPTWECTNCFSVTARQVRKAKTGISATQQRVIDSIANAEGYDITEITTTDNGPIFVLFKQDTDKGFLSETTYHALLGNKGKIRLLSVNRVFMEEDHKPTVVSLFNYDTGLKAQYKPFK